MRRIARGALALSAIVLTPLFVYTGLNFAQGESLPVAQFVGILAIAAITGVLAASSVLLARRYVTLLELWPQSNLAHVRTAGLGSEKIHLIPWQEFRANRGIISAHARDPYLRVHLRSGRHLAFEQTIGEAPQGWIALQRFATRRGIPETVTTIRENSLVERGSPAPDLECRLASSRA